MPTQGSEDSPVAGYRICTVVLLTRVYLLMLATACVVWHHTAGALCRIATASLALLFIGIHNAWDTAVWMTITRQGKWS